MSTRLVIALSRTDGLKGMTGKRIHGGTTISGTMILSQLAGIRIFGTGGLGKSRSAHRHVQQLTVPQAAFTVVVRLPWTFLVCQTSALMIAGYNS